MKLLVQIAVAALAAIALSQPPSDQRAAGQASKPELETVA